MKPNKRKRSENWDSSDKLLLETLVQAKIDLIEDKNVDTNTSMAKRAAWMEVLYAFNKRSNTKRDFPQIHSQWRRIKMQYKNKDSTNGGERRATVRGSYSKSPDPMAEHLMVFTKDEFIVDHSVLDYDSSNPQDSIPHSDEHPNDRYLEKSYESKNAEAQHLKNKYEEEIETLRLERSLKIKAFEAEQKRKDEEHRMKLQFMEEEHQLKIELITERNS